MRPPAMFFGEAPRRQENHPGARDRAAQDEPGQQPSDLVAYAAGDEIEIHLLGIGADQDVHLRPRALFQRIERFLGQHVVAVNGHEPADPEHGLAPLCIAQVEPDAVANANAQLPAHAPTETPQSVSAKADSVLKGISNGPDATAAPVVDAGAQVVAEDQLNELDRAASTEKADDKPALTLASATIDAPPVVSPTNSTTLDQTSLIGKIFIAFGGLLTLASAARMFIA
eukprot:gene37733-50939_t